MKLRTIGMLLLAASPLISAPIAGAETNAAPASPADAPKAAPKPASRFRLHADIEMNYRDSKFVEVKDPFPFPPDFLPPGQNAVFLRTVSRGNSLEVSNVALIGEADLTPDILARVNVHFLDLYNRNPTTSDDRVHLREAWIRFGSNHEGLEPLPGTSLYLLVGKAARFSKQQTRRLESYGLWGTAVGRFEQIQAQVGGSFGTHVYWRGSFANGNPLFIRDPNALAGDNGTPERVPGNVHPIDQSGFPILYDTKSNDTNFSGKFEGGGGLGVRFTGDPETGNGVDAMGWYFHRNLADKVPIRGSFYSGDILLLTFGFPGIALHGRSKTEYGGNVEWRLEDFHLFGQYVEQDIAGLKRHGFEAEAAYSIPLNGLFLSGETPVFNYVQPAFRFSNIQNEFKVPTTYPDPAVGWNWRKYDFGVRIGIIRGVDLTVEYAHNDVVTKKGLIHPDETLVTLRAGF